MTLTTVAKLGLPWSPTASWSPSRVIPVPFGQLHHAARLCNVANGFGEQGGVFWGFVHAGL